MKIGIANDVSVAAEALRRAIAENGEHQVLWIAENGVEAVRFCARQRPDLLLMDLIMPEMDGVEATRIIMRDTPCAILIVTASPQDNSAEVFRAMGAGALDVTATPVLSSAHSGGAALLAKIKMIGKLIQAESRPREPTALDSAQGAGNGTKQRVDTLIAIGASTGGPIALAKILSELPPSTDTAIVIVQHIDREFAVIFADWLSTQASWPIDIIEADSPLRPGRIHLAKTNDHLLLDAKLRLGYSESPRDYPYRPSINVFFHCIARHWQNRAIGVLLTGMGRDGAEGLLAMRKMGKKTIAQNKASSAVYGMPRAAVEIDAAEAVLPLEEIGAMLRKDMLRNLPH
jgi:two-component system response regulator WspF